MEVREAFEVESPADRVYDALNDVGRIGYCVAGVNAIAVIDEDRSLWTVEQRFGFISRTFELSASITERRPGEQVSFAAAGQEVSISGRVALHVVDECRTRAEVFLQIDVTGPLAPLVEIFAKGPQEALIRQTLANLKAHLQADRGTPSAQVEVGR